MEMSWTTAHGQARVGPMRNDFLYPHPYPPLYLLANGWLLRVFGDDILVARGFQAVIGVATAVALFWVGSRLRDKNFGFLCAAAFLTYPEAVINCRWARPHPLTGLLVLLSAGFLVRYLQDKRLRDAVLAGLGASLAVGTHYYIYLFAAAVLVTTFFVNKRHVPAVVAALGVFPLAFVVWYLATHDGGMARLMTQVRRVGGYTDEPQGAGFIGGIAHVYRNIVSFCFTTPTLGAARNFEGVDLWLVAAGLGLVLFPVVRFRKWLAVWMLALMYPVFKKQDNVSIFFYPAMVFLPLMALGVAATLASAGEQLARKFKTLTAAPVVLPSVACGIFGLISLTGSLGHFRTKVDPWTIHSARDAEAVMDFVNANTKSDDLVVVPKHLDWLVKNARLANLPECLAYEGRLNEVFVAPIPRELFSYDCRWQNAKYLVLAYGQTAEHQAYGFDAVYTLGLTGVRQIIESIQAERWPTVVQQGEFMVLANPRFMKATGN